MSEEKICPACGVKIVGEEVYFSFPPGGKPQSKERLFARVCQFAKKPGCINSVVDSKACKVEDYYNCGQQLVSEINEDNVEEFLNGK